MPDSSLKTAHRSLIQGCLSKGQSFSVMLSHACLDSHRIHRFLAIAVCHALHAREKIPRSPGFFSQRSSSCFVVCSIAPDLHIYGPAGYS